MDEMSLKV